MFTKLHIIQYPTGKFGFVGKVHEKLFNLTLGTEKAARLAAQFVGQEVESVIYHKGA